MNWFINWNRSSANMNYYNNDFKLKKNSKIKFKQKKNGIKTIETQTFLDLSKISDKIYVIGNFEDPTYFQEYKSEFNQIFQLKE